MTYNPSFYILIFSVLLTSCSLDKVPSKAQDNGSGPLQRISNRDTLIANIPLLTEGTVEERIAIAYALGQTGDTSYIQPLIKGFVDTDTAGIYAKSNGTILEALGKIASETTLHQLSTISTYQPEDTLLLLGRARALYRFALRSMVDSLGTAVMVDYATEASYPLPVRIMAAHYLSRPQQVKLQNYEASIIHAIYEATDPNLKMALITALQKLPSEASLAILENTLQDTLVDFRVTVNALRALSSFNYESSGPLWKKTIKGHPNRAVRRTAAEQITAFGSEADGLEYYNAAKEETDPIIRALLFDATLTHLPAYYSVTRKAARWQLQQIFSQNQNNPVARAKALNGLSKADSTEAIIYQLGYSDPSPLVKKAAVEAMRTFPEGIGLPYLQKALEEGTPGMIYEIVQAIQSEDYQEEGLIEGLSKILDQLPVPEQLETKIMVQELLGIPKVDQSNFYFQSSGVPSKVEGARIVTTKGAIIIDLLPEYAPVTVAAFIKLVKDGFYSGLNFHRVVPNFVIQGGCPIGDGLAGPSFLLPTENGTIYYDQPGRVGMASAGRDTEGSQFFITHSPTPHLDGNYTIFATVIEGMEVVNKIQEGDIIEAIELL